jgi:hypothetical protein
MLKVRQRFNAPVSNQVGKVSNRALVVVDQNDALGGLEHLFDNGPLVGEVHEIYLAVGHVWRLVLVNARMKIELPICPTLEYPRRAKAISAVMVINTQWLAHSLRLIYLVGRVAARSRSERNSCVVFLCEAIHHFPPCVGVASGYQHFQRIEVVAHSLPFEMGEELTGLRKVCVRITIAEHLPTVFVVIDKPTEQSHRLVALAFGTFGAFYDL